MYTKGVGFPFLGEPTVNILVNKRYISSPPCFNGEYSGQNCLFMPQPQNSENLIFALFFAAFLRFFGVGSAYFAVKPRNYLKTARSAEVLKNLHLKCLKLSQNGLEMHNFPIFWRIFLATWAYFCPVF